MARTIVLCDFDNTLVESRVQYQGTFNTDFKLFRVDYRANTLQKTAEGPAEIFVSASDFQRIKQYLAQGQRRPGAINMEMKLKDGRRIIPGNYMIREPETFERFSPGEKVNYLLEDFKASEAREPKGNFKGPFWEHMVAMLSTEETAKSFGISTARGHSREEWVEFFTYLRDKKDDQGKDAGYIKFLPNFDLIFGVARPEFDQYGLNHNIASQKAHIFEEIAYKLARVPLTEKDKVLSPDGDRQEEFHYLLYIDDHQDAIDRATTFAQKMAQSKSIPIKFGIFNVGYAKDVREKQRPQFAIVQGAGTFRWATPLEQIGEPQNWSDEAKAAWVQKQKSGAQGCNEFLSQRKPNKTKD